ncbi:unnamed protein product [Umbelopsis sp. WA50703]
MLQTTSLQDVLSDPSGLSYFMEFMDRRGDMIRLQFWLLVEGFKTSSGGQAGRNDNAYLDDVRMVYDMYFAKSSPNRIAIPDDVFKELKHIVHDKQQPNEETSGDMNQASNILAKIQQIVYQDINTRDFPSFRRSDLYFKYLTTYANSNRDMTSASRRSLDDIFPNNSSTSVVRDEEPVIKTALPLERASSARPRMAPKWSMEDGDKADSDSEINHGRVSKSKIAPVRDAAHVLSNQNGTPPAVDYERPKGHSRASSDTSLMGNPNRFQSFGKFLEASNDWLPSSEWYPFRKKRDELLENNGNKRHSMAGSIQSLETTLEYDEDDNMTSSIGTLDESDRRAMMLQGEAYRTATVEAVEAEFQSIMDHGEMNISEQEDNNTDNDDDVLHPLPSASRSAPVSPHLSSRSPPPLPGRSSPSNLRSRNVSNDLSHPSSRTSLLIRPTKYAKASMALPVSNTSASPAWTSASNTKTTSEVAHDEMEVVSPLAIPKNIDSFDHADVNKEDDERSDVHLAPPGDLMLAVKIEKLSDDIEKLKQQESIVDALIKKAEGANKLEELRILQKSKNALIRELHQIEYQKSQYESQEFENVLVPGRTNVTITNSTIGTDNHGDYALYVIEVHQVGYDGNYDSGWVVGRRYSEFYSLHRRLQEQYSIVRMIGFPRKRAILKLQKTFVESRRIALERYLQQLIKNPDVCKSSELRSFLSQQNMYAPTSDKDDDSSISNGISTSSPLQRIGSVDSSNSYRGRAHFNPSPASSDIIDDVSRPSSSTYGDGPDSEQLAYNNGRPKPRHQNSNGFMRHIYKTVAQGIDDMRVGPSMLDLITQQLGQQVMQFTTDPEASLSPETQLGSESDNVTAAVVSAAASLGLNIQQAETASSETLQSRAAANRFAKLPEAEETIKFADSLCDLFIEMFELREKNNWLRRQAVVIVLQQLFGGTVERYGHDNKIC